MEYKTREIDQEKKDSNREKIKDLTELADILKYYEETVKSILKQHKQELQNCLKSDESFQKGEVKKQRPSIKNFLKPIFRNNSEEVDNSQKIKNKISQDIQKFYKNQKSDAVKIFGSGSNLSGHIKMKIKILSNPAKSFDERTIEYGNTIEPIKEKINSKILEANILELKTRLERMQSSLEKAIGVDGLQGGLGQIPKDCLWIQELFGHLDDRILVQNIIAGI